MRPRLARTLAVLALLFLAAGLVSGPGQGRTDGRTTAADIASRATVRPSLSGTSSAAAKSAGRAVAPLLRRMTLGVPAVVPQGRSNQSAATVKARGTSRTPATRTNALKTRSGGQRATTTTPPTSSPPSSKPKSTATSSPAPSTPVTDATSTATVDWACVREKESGGNYSEGGDEPYGGAYQFAVSTWQALGFPGVPNTSPPWMQDQAALKLWAWDLRYTGNPWSAWETAPMCGL